MDNQNENEREYNSNQLNGHPGIYSTPDLTVNPENIVPTGEAVSNTNQERIAAAFTQTDASNRVRAIARANQSFRTPVPFSSTATGDIQLQPSTQRNRKIPFVVIAAVAILAVIGGAVYAVVRGNMGNSSPIPEATAETAKEQFDQFAAYMLYGESSNELSGSYTRGKSYQLDQQAESDAYDSAYWSKSSELLQKAVDTYTSLGDSVDTALLEYLNSYQQDFLFLSEYTKLEDLTADWLTKTYIERGTEGAKKRIEDHYKALIEHQSGYAEPFITELISYYQLLIDSIKYYDDAGCFTTGQLDNVCIDNLVGDESTAALFSDLNNTKLDVINEEKRIAQNLEQNCWTISSWFESPSSSRESKE